ncbi:MAG: RHS repeat-associated core domain-containing protein [Candidatus Acidiferrales bacterium]
MTKMDGTVLDSLDYMPFGEQTSGDTGTTHKFTGKERDSESNLDNFEARYYSSQMGRFMSPDSIGGRTSNPQTLNRYSYVVNNPLNLTDPFGLWCVWDDGTHDDDPADGGASETECGSQGGLWDSTDTIYGVFEDATLSFNASDFQFGDSFGEPAGFDPTDLSDVSDGDPSVGMDIWHCAGCADIWQSTAGSMNAISAAYGLVYGGAVVGAAGTPYAISAAARGIGWGYATVGSGSAIVLGATPDYIDAAQAMGAKALNMPDVAWDALSAFGEEWTAEQAFIDTAVQRGYSISLAPGAGGGVNFWLELQYLRETGIDPASLPVVTVPH